MKKFLRSAAAVLIAMLCATAANANITINWSASGSTLLTHPGGTTCLAQGSFLKLGYLNTGITEGIAQANQDNIPFVRSNLFGPSTLVAAIGDGTGQDGSFAVSWNGTAFALPGKQMYILALNAPTVEAATEIGLYTNPNWIVPFREDLMTLDLGDPGLHVVIGDFSAGTITTPDGFAGSDAAQLHAIPEPASFVLVGIGILGLLGLICRRN